MHSGIEDALEQNDQRQATLVTGGRPPIDAALVIYFSLRDGT